MKVYGNLGEGQYKNRVRDRDNDYTRMGDELARITTERDENQKKFNRLNSTHLTDVISLKTRNNQYKYRLSNLNQRIPSLEKQKANLGYNIKSTNATINRNKNNVLIPTERKFVNLKQETSDILSEILPLKKRENPEAKNYFNLLTSQNEEISTTISKQKNNLTTADRKYAINDSKHPYYIALNKGLFILYIVIALYVIYRVLTGMITQNIYGKLIIVILIVLYPIYIFGLEKSIYNQYLFIKAMIRAEPYIPLK